MKKKLLTNILFAVVVLAIAAVLLAVRSHNATGGKLTAQLIYGDSNTVLDIPLEKDETYSVDTGYYTVHIEVKDGRARFVESPCPDHICEGFGWLSAEDQTATCLPARAVLTIVPVGRKKEYSHVGRKRAFPQGGRSFPAPSFAQG